ncbi:extracellular solute-binding protein [Paenibacillus sp. HJGM_3]|uniref:extracellular solute-binding protein n=1 Tax=Paenibacillus sp. HJGM_3 TaxID=3379816 RepID=UPI00385C1A71
MLNNVARKSSIWSLVSVLLLALLVSACGGSDTGGEGSATPQPSGKPAETAKKVDPASIKGEILWQYTVTVWPEAEIKNMIADFNKTYPNIKVNIQLGPLDPMIAAGNVPTIATFNRLEVNYIMDGLMEDLTPYMKKEPDFKAEQFNPTVWEIPRFEGGQYGIPMYLNPTYALVYNNKIMNQYGEKSIPKLQGLKDTDELFKKFWVMKNGELEMTGDNPLFYYGNLSGLFFVSYLNGADPKTFYNPDTKKANFNDTKIVEALEWMVRFNKETVNADALAKMKAALPKGTHPFVAEKQAMMVITSNDLVAFKKAKPDLDLTVVPAPQASLWNGGSNLAILKGGKDKEAAWEFIKWMTNTEEGAASLYNRLGLITPKKDTKFMKDKAASDPDLKVFMDIANQATKYIPQFPVAYDVEYKKLFPDMMAGKITPKELMDHVNKDLQAKIDEFYKTKVKK